ncbi:MAG: TonB-dependent receptor [Candidatus Acidiferrales bacterium]
MKHTARRRLRSSACAFAWAASWVCLATAGAPIAHAQVAAAISGTVEDPSGDGINGATVTVKNLETQATRTVTTDQEGNFTVLGLSPGLHEVKAQKSGFDATVRTGINLEVGQEAVVNLRLEISAFMQQIVVSGGTPLVNTTTAPVSGMVGEREVKDLPLNGRSFDNLITLNPGAINFGAMKSAQTSTSNGNTFTVAGRRTTENLFLLNGIEYTGSSQLAITPGGVSGELLGIDAIREFNVLTDTYPAEYGKRAGAQVSIVTQSGSNTLHGSIFEFLRNSALDAKSFFATESAPPFEQNEFGGAAGGPLKKNRWFLFGNYEGFRQALTVSNVAVVPDQQARQGFLPNSSGIETQVPNLNSAMLQYMSFWPPPNGAELLANGIPTGTAFSYNSPKQYIREDFGTLRTDYILGSRDTFSAAYTIDDGNSLVPLADPLFASFSALRMQVASLQESHIFSPDVLNTFRVGFSRAGFNLASSLLASFPASLDFVTGAGPGGIVIGGSVTTTGVAALTSAGPSNGAGVWNRRNLFTYTDDVLISRGIHQISMGVWFQRLQDNEDSASRQLGQTTFSNLTTFLQGTVSTFQVVPSPQELGWRSFFGAWYAEDAISIRKNLTVRAGVRHEFTTGWNEAFGRAANFLVGPSGVLLTNPQVGNSVFTQNNAKLPFSPRIGMAWDPFGNGKTAVRAGFGTYYSLIDDLAFLLNSVPPYNGALTFSGALSSITPIARGVPLPPSCGPGVPAPCATFAPQGVQANAKTPTVEEWNLIVERQLSGNTLFRVSYVGSHGYHGFVSVDPNTIPAQTCTAPSGCQAGGVAPSGLPASPSNQSHVPEGTEYIPVGTRPNPYLGAGFFWFTEGNSSYNALETEVAHRLGKGLQFRANYTWSKNLDMNSALTGAQAINEAQMILDRNDLRRDWGPSALNISNQASISAHYELPFGQDKHWLGTTSGAKSKLFDGWQLNGIATFLSGFPITPLVGSNRSGDGDTRNPDRPSLNSGFSGPIVLGKPNEWFNPNAFVLPSAGTYGDIGRGTLTGPGLADVDVSLLKNTAVTERMSLEFRAEFFSVLNRVNFGPPNTTVFANGAINASAGLITTLATNPRQIQFGLKLIF